MRRKSSRIQEARQQNTTAAAQKPSPRERRDQDMGEKRCVLARHVLVHTGEKLYTCQVCKRDFADRSNLNRHRRRLHSGEKPHLCKQCGKSFAAIDTLNVHVRRHTGERPHACEECGLAFACKQTLLVHRRRHTGEKPYSCEECGMTFAGGGNLARHRRGHAGEKPYSCEECGVAFADRSSVTRHQSRFHQRGKEPGPVKERHTAGGSATRRGQPHRCGECSASFPDAFQLSHHRYQWHEDRQRLGCTRCRTWFDCALQLRRHLETHTEGLRFECGDCQQRFATRTQVISHHCKHH